MSRLFHEAEPEHPLYRGDALVTVLPERKDAAKEKDAEDQPAQSLPCSDDATESQQDSTTR